MLGDDDHDDDLAGGVLGCELLKGRLKPSGLQHHLCSFFIIKSYHYVHHHHHHQKGQLKT